MISDSERRKVAANLRESAGNSDLLRDAFLEEILAGDTGFAFGEDILIDALLRHLADLIEPKPMIDDFKRREVARLLRERAGYEIGCVFKEMYGDCNSAGPTCGECNERAMRYVADLLDPPDYLETADEDAAAYADAETMQDERGYRYQRRIGSVTLKSNNGYDLLDAMLELGA